MAADEAADGAADGSADGSARVRDFAADGPSDGHPLVSARDEVRARPRRQCSRTGVERRDDSHAPATAVPAPIRATRRTTRLPLEHHP